jgi:MtN3 and saliva related transmembrane protein
MHSHRQVCIVGARIPRIIQQSRNVFLPPKEDTMDLQQIVGLAAGTFTTVSFLPQLIRTVKTRSSRDLSVGMVSFFLVGIVLWLMYGVMARAWPIILANGVTLVLALILLVLIMRYRK